MSPSFASMRQFSVKISASSSSSQPQNATMHQTSQDHVPWPWMVGWGPTTNTFPVWRLGVCRLSVVFYPITNIRTTTPQNRLWGRLINGTSWAELRLSNFDPKLIERLSSPNPWRPRLTPGLNNSFSKSHFFFIYYHHPYRKLRNNHFFNHSPIYPKPVKYKVIHTICEHNVANIYYWSFRHGNSSSPI